MEEKPAATLDAAPSASDRSGHARPFDYTTIPPGHYDLVYRRRRGIQSKWHHLKFARIAREVAGRRRLLDVGCGPGTLLGVLGDEFDTVGVDITEPQIAYAREVYGEPNRTFHACALEELPRDSEPFDAVTAVELIEHLPEEMAMSTLRDAVARLRPGGKLVLTTPDFRSAWPIVQRMVDRLGDVQYEVQHINRLTRPRLREMLDELGLVEVEVRKYLFAAPFAALLGWRVADLVSRVESGFLEDRLGLIMLGTGIKPQ